METQRMASRMVAWLAAFVGLGAGLGLLAGCGHNAQPAAPATGTPTSSPSDPVLSGPERHILALGDSLFAGYGLRPEQAYPQQLEAALRARGMNVRVSNAGVSGDTTADGLARLKFTLSSQPQPPDLVLICLGGNDMLRGLPPAQTRANLAAMLAQLQQRHIPVVLMGMLAAPNLGKAYESEFDPIYPALARQYHDALVPFFLSAVIDRPDLRLPDHIHPTPAGVQAIVAATQPALLKALGR
jgi:acyl-CoA thioesterase-1